MKRMCRWNGWSLAVLLGTSFCHLFSQPSAGFRLTARYDREGLPVSHWEFQIDGNGTAVYRATHTQTATSLVKEEAPIRFQMSRTGTTLLAEWLSSSHNLEPCETKAKNLARMGMKNFEYQPAGGAVVQCRFNYTDNKPLAAAADYLAGTSYTLEEGATIDRLHRFDRLGLDPVLERLSIAARQGKAHELDAIRPSLESLVEDDLILERVRLRASELLKLSKKQ